MCVNAEFIEKLDFESDAFAGHATKMTSSNLGVVFGPVLLPPPCTTAFQFLACFAKFSFVLTPLFLLLLRITMRQYAFAANWNAASIALDRDRVAAHLAKSNVRKSQYFS